MADAAERLAAFAAGRADAGDALRAPLMVVDAGSGDALSIEVPPAYPAVVVAVAEETAPPLSPRGPDVALTRCPAPPRPWVAVEDLASALASLATRVATTPGAAAALVGLLRVSGVVAVDEGLVLESLCYSMLLGGPEFGRWRAGRPAPPDRREPAEAVRVDRRGDVLEVELNRPHVHNAYNRAVRDGLSEALAIALADPSLSVLLRGAGPSFCSGGDLDEFGTFPDPVTAHLVRTARSPARLIACLESRVEARLHGSCAGSGLELPAFAGHVTADPRTRMWLPELAMGLIPGAGGTVSIPRRVGRGRAAWMALSGQVVDAVTAVAWGLVDEVR